MLEQAAAFAGDERITARTIDLAFGATGRNFANLFLDAVVARDAAQRSRRSKMPATPVPTCKS